jgi:hypothetical protein
MMMSQTKRIYLQQLAGMRAMTEGMMTAEMMINSARK